MNILLWEKFLNGLFLHFFYIVEKEKIMSKVEGSKYEELRMQRITENQAKIEALGLSKLATIFKDRIQKAKKKG